MGNKTEDAEGQKKCDMCGLKRGLVEIECEGAKQRGEDNPTIWACGCLHGGDYMCNCGNPCWSFF